MRVIPPAGPVRWKAAASIAVMMPGDRDKCIDAGASEYLSKPIDPDALLAMMNALLSRYAA